MCSGLLEYNLLFVYVCASFQSCKYIYLVHMTKLGLFTDLLPTSSCLLGYWMPPIECPLSLLVPEDAPIIDRLPLQSALGLWVTPGTNTDFLHWLQSWLPIEAEYELVPNGLWVCKHYIGGQPRVWYRKFRKNIQLLWFKLMRTVGDKWLLLSKPNS